MNDSTASTSRNDVDLAELDAEIRADLAARPKAPARITGIVLLVGSALGWISSIALSVDKLALLENPNAALSCDINPLISCGTFLGTWQASLFGFPNMYLGLAGYAVMGAAGSLLVSNAKLPRWFMWAVFGGLVFAFAFVHWLAFNALFDIRALCPWCLVAWVGTAPMFFVVLAHLVEEGFLKVGGAVRRIFRAWIPLTLAWYVLVVAAITVVFLPQWSAMLS